MPKDSATAVRALTASIENAEPLVLRDRVIEGDYNPASLAERQIPNRLAITSTVSRSPQP